MPVDWINEDGTFAEGFEQNLPEPVREYAKGFKDVGSALKSGLESRQGFRERVKLPEDDESKRAFLKEHFQSILDADAEAKAAADQKAAEEAKAKAEAEAQTKREQMLVERQATVKKMFGGENGEDFDTNMEVARRAIRHDDMPEMVKELMAAAVGVDGFAKVSDDDIRTILSRDPLMAVVAQAYGEKIMDGTTVTGDGKHVDSSNEKEPLQPDAPHLYADRPAGHPNRQWFENRGYVFENGKVRLAKTG